MIDWISVTDEKPKAGQEIIFLDRGTGEVCKSVYSCGHVGWWAGETYDYWYPYNPPVKKRWRPVEPMAGATIYYFINTRGEVNQGIWSECSNKAELEIMAYTGLHKTKEEAEHLRDKIREFVTSQIGSVWYDET